MQDTGQDYIRLLFSDGQAMSDRCHCFDLFLKKNPKQTINPMNHTKPNSHTGVHKQWPSQHAHQQLCASSGYSLSKQWQLFFPSWQFC